MFQYPSCQKSGQHLKNLQGNKMRQLTNLTSEPIQNFVLKIGSEEAKIQFRFYPTVQMWCFNLSFRGIDIKGIKISLGVLHITSYNFPFDFIAEDTSNSGIDPFKNNDFEIERIRFYMLTADEMKTFRGYSVKV